MNMEAIERVARRNAEEDYEEYLRLTRELEDRKDARTRMEVEAIKELGNSLTELVKAVTMQKQPTVVNLLVTDPSDPKIQDFVDKIADLKSKGML